MVVGKRVAPPAGTTVVLEVDGSAPIAVRWARTGVLGGRRPDAPVADGAVAMDRESFIVLAGGRRYAAPAAITIEGDQELGERILDQLAITP